MPLINCKAELKFKWTKHYVLAADGNDNDDMNSNNTFTIKITKLYVPVVTLSAKDNQKLSKRLSKEFERSVYWNDIKQTARIKTNKRLFSRMKFCWSYVFFWFIQININMLKGIKLKDITYQKVLLRIITSSMETSTCKQ